MPQPSKVKTENLMIDKVATASIFAKENFSFDLCSHLGRRNNEGINWAAAEK